MTNFVARRDKQATSTRYAAKRRVGRCSELIGLVCTITQLAMYVVTANGRRQPGKQKQKKRGRSKIQTQLRRKQQNVIDANLLKLRQAQAEEEEEAKQEEGGGAQAKQQTCAKVQSSRDL